MRSQADSSALLAWWDLLHWEKISFVQEMQLSYKSRLEQTPKSGSGVWESALGNYDHMLVLPLCPRHSLQSSLRDSMLGWLDLWSHLTLVPACITILYRYGSVWTYLWAQVLLCRLFPWESHEQQQQQQQKKSTCSNQSQGLVHRPPLKSEVSQSWKLLWTEGRGRVNRDTWKIIWVPWYCLLVPAPQIPNQKHKIMLY